MVDLETVCCMCGDVGFPDKLFRCKKCLNRFQHSYCSSYYSEYVESPDMCDWCQSDEKRGQASKQLARSSSKRSQNARGYNSNKYAGGGTSRSQYSADRIKQTPDRHESSAPSPRPATRRYKLLKDVMC